MTDFDRVDTDLCLREQLERDGYLLANNIFSDTDLFPVDRLLETARKEVSKASGHMSIFGQDNRSLLSLAKCLNPYGAYFAFSGIDLKIPQTAYNNAFSLAASSELLSIMNQVLGAPIRLVADFATMLKLSRREFSEHLDNPLFNDEEYSELDDIILRNCFADTKWECDSSIYNFDSSGNKYLKVWVALSTGGEDTGGFRIMNKSHLFRRRLLFPRFERLVGVTHVSMRPGDVLIMHPDLFIQTSFSENDNHGFRALGFRYIEYKNDAIPKIPHVIVSKDNSRSQCSNRKSNLVLKLSSLANLDFGVSVNNSSKTWKKYKRLCRAWGF